MLIPIAGFVLSMSADGRVVSHGATADILEIDDQLREEAEESKLADKKKDQVIDYKPEEGAKKGDGKLVVAEEIVIGHIGWTAGRPILCSFVSN